MGLRTQFRGFRAKRKAKKAKNAPQGHDVVPLIPHAESSNAELSSSNAQASSSGPQVSLSKPQVLISEPQVSSSKPQVSISKPQDSTSNPQASSSHPPALSSHPPALSSHPPALSSHPQALSSHPQASPVDPQAPGQAPDSGLDTWSRDIDILLRLSEVAEPRYQEARKAFLDTTDPKDLENIVETLWRRSLSPECRQDALRRLLGRDYEKVMGHKPDDTSSPARRDGRDLDKAYLDSLMNKADNQLKLIVMTSILDDVIQMRRSDLSRGKWSGLFIHSLLISVAGRAATPSGSQVHGRDRRVGRSSMEITPIPSDAPPETRVNNGASETSASQSARQTQLEMRTAMAEARFTSRV
ncbi:uncharacterized protein EI97DRAFT_111446 [Westerdykella ornata]|uniref:Uncharacterized protein n=1 Tax=Westerdykella ornata TaxID=318751 RepID=A0A6A6JV44_WESOR|nr:uncharacterized protein EI97DRAFT_111446 [Westerdykella ornata]KAF2280115.1 hypothetical protein EI97DRAFT_111446 [Westerdykella ornata]